MTVLTFPSSPIEGQVYNAPTGVRYVYDGVKWIVETTTSTSEAVSNSTQDRVAPMFVEGNNQGITFTYNAETNTMSAEVTAVNGNRLVNGALELTFNSDGHLVYPAGSEHYDLGAGESILSHNIEVNNNIWAFGSDGNLTAPGSISFPNGNVIDMGVAGKFILETGGNTDLDIITIGDGPSTYTWSFGRDGILTVPSGGAIQQRFTWTRAVQPNLSTASAVIWTALYDYISSVKLTIQLEANETGDATGWHSQVCEAVVASRGYANSAGGPLGEPVMTVYGVTYTSTVPLVTFTVQRNPTTKQIEIVGTQTAACGSSPNFRIHSVEMATRD